MAIKTYNNAGSNFTLVRGGEINGDGDVQNGYYAFADSDVYNNDFSENISANITQRTGEVEIIGNYPDHIIVDNPGTMADTPYVLLNNPTSGDFKARIKLIDADETGARGYAVLGYRESDTKYLLTRLDTEIYTLGTTDAVAHWYEEGVRTQNKFASALPFTYPCWLQLERDGNMFTFSVADTLNDLESENGTFVSHSQDLTSFNYTTTGNIFFAANGSYFSDVPAIFGELEWVSGNPGSTELKIHDSGDAYMDAGENYAVDKKSVYAIGNGNFFVKEESNDSGTFESYSNYLEWNNISETDNYPYPTEENRYWWPYITMSGDSSTFTSLVFETKSTLPDNYAPSGIEVYFSYKDFQQDSLDIFLKWHNGQDYACESGYISGYRGTSIGYYNSNNSTWYYLQSEGNWGANENYNDLYFYEGSGAKWVEAFQEIPSEVTKIRYTGWDNNENRSHRIDEELSTGTGLSNYGSGVIYYSENEYYDGEIYKQTENANSNNYYVFNPFGN